MNNDNYKLIAFYEIGTLVTDGISLIIGLVLITGSIVQSST